MLFQLGEIVRLRSGGPHMTVAGNARTDVLPPTVRCEWFAAGNLCSHEFAIESLTAVEEEPGR